MTKLLYYLRARELTPIQGVNRVISGNNERKRFDINMVHGAKYRLIRTARAEFGFFLSEYLAHSDSSHRFWLLSVRILSSFGQLEQVLAPLCPNTWLIRTARTGFCSSLSEYLAHSDSSSRFWLLSVRILGSFGQLEQNLASFCPNT
ncbi:hypothetical protein [Mesobacillus harenae]|uniref:hypothetical protein n=1 Tax=Mesobacillus harenae TaxID=2213203 RepID=UPI0015812952|nr:hypothetical protein [Mesobacillus harenae]